MSITIIKSGILDTVQDSGRIGFSKWGINPGGAMDLYAMQIANALAGNPLNTEVIEIHFPSGEYLFNSDCLISITGADFTPQVNGAPVNCRKSLLIQKGSILSFAKKKNGARTYLAVHQGFSTPKWLSSSSTNLKISVEGLPGALKKGPEIGLRAHNDFSELLSDKNFFEFPWSVNSNSAYDNTNIISIIDGNEWNQLTEKSQDQILRGEFSIGLASDRMAYHLEGEPLEYNAKTELISSAVSFGTIQGLPNGSLLILMADHQTTGGYPRIAHVATANLPKLSQLNARDKITFKKITIDEAEKMLFSLMREIKMIQSTCRQNLLTHHAIR